MYSRYKIKLSVHIIGRLCYLIHVRLLVAPRYRSAAHFGKFAPSSPIVFPSFPVQPLHFHRPPPFPKASSFSRPVHHKCKPAAGSSNRMKQIHNLHPHTGNIQGGRSAIRYSISANPNTATNIFNLSIISKQKISIF